MHSDPKQIDVEPKPEFRMDTNDAFPTQNPVFDADALAADAHNSTWTTPKTTADVSDTQTLHATSSGTMAGDPLADITFNLAISR